MSYLPNELGQAVVRACLAMGFARAGVARAEPSRWGAEYADWLRAGRHGDMEYLTEMLDERLDVRRLLPGSRSVIVVADQYAARGVHELIEMPDRSAVGLIAKYARGRDYHAVIKKRLHVLCDRLREKHEGAKFRAFTDTGPALEREHAARAGLGFIGKHTLLIDPRAGSYLLLGGVATTLELCMEGPNDARSHAPPTTDHCGSCTACIDACPTGAIQPYRVDATRCVSYLTLEHRGPIDASLHEGVGDRLIGCDVCQDVCPFNRSHEEESGQRVNAAYADDAGVRTRLPILEVLGWRDEDRMEIFGPSAAKRASVAMIRRNAVVIAGNALGQCDDAALRERILAIAADSSEPPLVGDTARQIMAKLDAK